MPLPNYECEFWGSILNANPIKKNYSKVYEFSLNFMENTLKIRTFNLWRK